MTTFCKKCWAT